MIRFSPFSPVRLCRLLVTGAFGVLISPSFAQEIPAGGTEMIAQTTAGLAGYYSGDGPVTSREIVAVAGQSFAEATRVATLSPTGQFYSSAVTFTSDRAVANGDVVLLHFFARMEETTDESGTAVMTVYVEGPAPGFTKSVSVRVNVASAWQEFFIPFEVDGAYASGQLGFKFGFGATGRPQVLDFGGVEAFWYGTSKILAEMPRTSFDYSGRAVDASWRAAAAVRIDQYRKGNYAVKVMDGEGSPLADTSVRVRQVKHAFEFGTAMVASRIMDSSSSDAATYRQKVLQLFNSGTLENDTKWPAWLGQFGSSFNQPQTVSALQWAQQRGLTMRGHVLVWPSVRNLPNQIGDLVTAKDASVPGLITSHIQDVMTTTRGLFSDWDVINEPFDNFDVMNNYGYDLMAEWFKTAGAQESGVGLFINDYGILSGGGLNQEKQDAYAVSINRIKSDGGPITGVAFQGHFSGTPTSITKVWEILERYATEFPDLDMRITEFDITGDDEALKADYLRDFYTIAFSHPKMLGVQMWGFWASAHWKAESALYAADWSERPLGQSYRELVTETWRTNEVGVSGSDGMVTGRGFAGDYVVEDLSGRWLGQFTLTKDSSAVTPVVVGESSGGRLSNLSTRGAVGTGSNIMVAGFVIEGSTTKDLVIRAVGPRLADFGVPGALADPQIAVFRSGETVPMAEVDGWESSLSSIFQTLGAFSLESDSASAATRLQLPPGPYTVHVKGVAEGTGVALVEVYDAAANVPVQMTNLSTRGAVGTGANIMVAGFVITGDAPQRVLVRGVGPALADFGVTGALADPVLRLFRSTPSGAELLQTNQDWSTATNSAQIASTASTVGGFALAAGAGDAALLVDLAPGSYTVELSGANDGTGIGLIEVYRVP
ncbi:MAG: endo-1,4-beta-xylanase [Opitutaceae bacterium]